MSKSADFKPELRPFFDLFRQLAYRHDYSRVFHDFLTICLTQFTAPGLMEYEHAQAVAPYSKEERALFGPMMREYITVTAHQLGAYPRNPKTKSAGELALFEGLARAMGRNADMVVDGEPIRAGDIPWYDFLGDFYMEICQGGYRSKAMGQFFTPEHICDLMARITTTNDDGKLTGAKLRISDPTCGSGRMAMATNSLAPGNYYSLQDLDIICCKMTVLNMLTHGIMGEVVHCDALQPDDYKQGWAVNMHLNSHGKYIELPNGRLPLRGVPHVFPQAKEASYVWTAWQQQAELVEKYGGKHPDQLAAEQREATPPGKAFPLLPPARPQKVAA